MLLKMVTPPGSRVMHFDAPARSRRRPSAPPTCTPPSSPTARPAASVGRGLRRRRGASVRQDRHKRSFRNGDSVCRVRVLSVSYFFFCLFYLFCLFCLFCLLSGGAQQPAVCPVEWARLVTHRFLLRCPQEIAGSSMDYHLTRWP